MARYSNILALYDPHDNYPIGLGFDGRHLLVGGHGTSPKGVVIHFGDGTLLARIQNQGGTNCYGVSFDGRNWWLTSSDSPDKQVWLINPVSGQVLANWTIPTTESYFGQDIVFNGRSLYTGENEPSADENLLHLSVNGDVLDSFDFPSSCGPEGLAFDGRSLYIGDSWDNVLYQVEPKGFTVVDIHNACNDEHTIIYNRGATFDGRTMWWTQGSDTLTDYLMQRALFREYPDFINDYQVEASWDDAYTYSDNGWFDEFDSSILFIHTTYHAQAYIRFRDLQVPQGKTITAAYLKFKASATRTTGSEVIRVKCLAEDNVGNFPNRTTAQGYAVTDNYYDYTYPSTTANAWYTIQGAGLIAAIQEVVNRGGWVKGNALGFRLDAQDLGASNAAVRAWDGFLPAHQSAMRLHIEWS